MLTNRKSTKMADTESAGSDVDNADETPFKAVKLSGAIHSQKRSNVPVRTNNLNERKSSSEKAEELTNVKIDALNQLESTIKMSDIIDSKNAKIASLQGDIKLLKRDLKDTNENLIESNRLNKELSDKVQRLLEFNARQRLELDDLRTASVTDDGPGLSPANSDGTSSYSRYLNEIIDNREKLLLENDRLMKRIDEQRLEVDKLHSYILQLEESHEGVLTDYRYIDETTVELRSKSDLLKLLRTQMDDKVVWMEYAIRLTKEAVRSCPGLLNIGESRRDESEDERWRKFGIAILRRVGQTSPQTLDDLVKIAGPDQIGHLTLQ